MKTRAVARFTTFFWARNPKKKKCSSFVLLFNFSRAFAFGCAELARLMRRLHYNSWMGLQVDFSSGLIESWCFLNANNLTSFAKTSIMIANEGGELLTSLCLLSRLQWQRNWSEELKNKVVHVNILGALKSLKGFFHFLLFFRLISALRD